MFQPSKYFKLFIDYFLQELSELLMLGDGVSTGGFVQSSGGGGGPNQDGGLHAPSAAPIGAERSSRPIGAERRAPGGPIGGQGSGGGAPPPPMAMPPKRMTAAGSGWGDLPPPPPATNQPPPPPPGPPPQAPGGWGEPGYGPQGRNIR